MSSFLALKLPDACFFLLLTNCILVEVPEGLINTILVKYSERLQRNW